MTRCCLSGLSANVTHGFARTVSNVADREMEVRRLQLIFINRHVGNVNSVSRAVHISSSAATHSTSVLHPVTSIFPHEQNRRMCTDGLLHGNGITSTVFDVNVLFVMIGYSPDVNRVPCRFIQRLKISGHVAVICDTNDIVDTLTKDVNVSRRFCDRLKRSNAVSKFESKCIGNFRFRSIRHRTFQNP